MSENSNGWRLFAGPAPAPMRFMKGGAFSAKYSPEKESVWALMAGGSRGLMGEVAPSVLDHVGA